MPNIFSSKPGSVTAVGSSNPLPLKVTMGSWGDYASFKAIITEAGVNRGGRFQFLYSMRDFIYFYSFGELLGEISISGIAFSSACPGEGGTAGSKSGFEHVLDYYEKNRISRIGSPISISIGTAGFSAFLTNIGVVAQDAQQQIAPFKMKFLFPPNPRPAATFATIPTNAINFISSFAPREPSANSLGSNQGQCCPSIASVTNAPTTSISTPTASTRPAASNGLHRMISSTRLPNAPSATSTTNSNSTPSMHNIEGGSIPGVVAITNLLLRR